MAQLCNPYYVLVCISACKYTQRALQPAGTCKNFLKCKNFFKCYTEKATAAWYRRERHYNGTHNSTNC